MKRLEQESKVAKFEEFLTNLVTLKELDNAQQFVQLIELDEREKESRRGESKELNTSRRRSARLVKQDAFVPDVKDHESEGEPPQKRKRKLSIDSTISKKSRSSDSVVPNLKKKKKCSYCNTTATPMWRHGPDHCPVLCNSCGVKFKRGRILSENGQEMISIPSPAPTEVESPIEEFTMEPVNEQDLEKSFNEIFETSLVTDSMVYKEPERKKTKFYPCARLIPLKDFKSTRPIEPEFVSEISKPMPVKVPTIGSHEDYYYPAPENLVSPNERHAYLAEKMSLISPEKLAQLLCIIDPQTKNDLIFATKFRKDVHFDVSKISDSCWIQICEMFGH
jgi:hypothetical protein